MKFEEDISLSIDAWTCSIQFTTLHIIKCSITIKIKYLSHSLVNYITTSKFNIYTHVNIVFIINLMQHIPPRKSKIL